MKTLIRLSIVAAAAIATAALAQTPASQSHESHSKMAEAKAAEGKKAGAEPASFVKHAAQDGLAEVELGQLALSKSQNADVRKFAQRMVQDHGKANSELTAIATRKQLEVPKKPGAEHQATTQELRGKSGAEFDAAYAQHMAMDHGKAVALFESASQGKDDELAAFAKKTLPTLEEHKNMADDLNGRSRSAEAKDSTSAR
jgi:putative membrane protein